MVFYRLFGRTRTSSLQGFSASANRLSKTANEGAPCRKASRRCWHSMLDTPSNTSSDIRLQSFSVAYEYPVMFTRDAFDPANRCLIDAFARKEAGKLHRCAIFVDEGVLSAMPEFQ